MFKKNYVGITMAYLMFLLFGLIGFAIFNSFDFSSKQIIKVGTSPDYPPLEFKKNNKLVGFDIDLINEIAKDQNFKVEFKEINFDNLITSIQNNKIDVIASGFSQNPEREKVVNFSKGYLNEGNILVKKNKEQQELSKITNEKIGVLSGSTQLDVLKEKNATNIKVFDNQQVALKALESGNIDYVYTGVSQKKEIDNLKKFTTYLDEQTKPDTMSLAISKTNPNLKTKIDKAIVNLYKNKTLKKLGQKWFGTDLYKNFKIK